VRGYFEIGIYNPKSEVNIGTLWRSAYILGASGIFTIGRRYREQASDTLKATRHIPLRHFLEFDDFFETMPKGARLIGIEECGKELHSWCHPHQAVYLLGAEDYGLPQKVQDKCHSIVSIENVRDFCYNVATAGSIVMYDRLIRGTY